MASDLGSWTIVYLARHESHHFFSIDRNKTREPDERLERTWWREKKNNPKDDHDDDNDGDAQVEKDIKGRTFF